MQNMKQKNFFKRLEFYLGRSETAYKSYLAGGKLFIYSKALKESNNILKEFLENYAHFAPGDCLGALAAIMHHLDIWTLLWEDAFEKRAPLLGHVFVFQNSVIFPREQMVVLEKYFQKYK